MSAQRCLICKYLDKNLGDSLSQSLFFKKDRHTQILLCYIHSIEYFKLGQSRFFRNYSRQFKEFSLPEDAWVIEYLNEVEAKHS